MRYFFPFHSPHLKPCVYDEIVMVPIIKLLFRKSVLTNNNKERRKKKKETKPRSCASFLQGSFSTLDHCSQEERHLWRTVLR